MELRMRKKMAKIAKRENTVLSVGVAVTLSNDPSIQVNKGEESELILYIH
jgi:hypothetical protein